jgi:hypothetical protein
MGRTYSTHVGGLRIADILAERSQTKRQLEEPKHKCENNIKTTLRETRDTR